MALIFRCFPAVSGRCSSGEKQGDSGAWEIAHRNSTESSETAEARGAIREPPSRRFADGFRRFDCLSSSA